MNYNEALEYVLHIPRYKKKSKHDSVVHMLKILGSPEKELKVIHVVGTNGKGSVSAFINGIGMYKGFKMGLFTSPHLLTIRERFQIDGEMISEEDFIVYLECVLAAENRIKEDGYDPLTFFEIMLLIAVLYFRDKKVDYAIIEAGMGGRSDSTNELGSLMTIITAIGLDHMSILGDTIEKIAYEKVGAVNHGEIAIISKQSKNIIDIIEDYVYVVGAEAHYANHLSYKLDDISEGGLNFTIKPDTDEACQFHLSMMGAYQVDNAVTSILAAKKLWNMSYEELKEPLSKVTWQGRMEEVEKGFYVDGAHNPQAIQSFVATLKSCFLDKSKILIYAVASDKDDRSMLKEILKIPSLKILIITELSNGRKTEAMSIVKLVDELVENECARKPDSVVVETTIDKAIEYAKSFREDDDYIFAVGSLYLVADVIKKL